MSEKQIIVVQPTFEDVKTSLPRVQPWREDVDNIPELFLCALGFEDRARCFAEIFASAIKNKATIGIVFEYARNEIQNERNRNHLENHLKKFCIEIKSTSASATMEIAELLSRYILKLFEINNERVNIVFDISTCSGNLILSVMHCLISHREKISLRIVYSEPEIYYPLEAKYNSNAIELIQEACLIGDQSSLLEYGVETIIRNELFQGVELENRSPYIIAVPGLRTNRLLSCIQDIIDQSQSDFSKIIHWILSEPPSAKLKWRLNFQKAIIEETLSMLIGLQPSDSLSPKLNQQESTICSTLDYLDIMKTILHITDEKLGHNVCLIFMGSKFQAIGTALAIFSRTEVALCTATPVSFNTEQYTKGIGNKWELDFGDFTKTISRINEIGQLHIIPKIETDRSGLPIF